MSGAALNGLFQTVAEHPADRGKLRRASTHAARMIGNFDDRAAIERRAQPSLPGMTVR
jgi:hypothetical protein